VYFCFYTTGHFEPTMATGGAATNNQQPVLRMITKASLVGAAMEMGALVNKSPCIFAEFGAQQHHVNMFLR
jgi:hypothetical protein